MVQVQWPLNYVHSKEKKKKKNPLGFGAPKNIWLTKPPLAKFKR